MRVSILSYKMPPLGGTQYGCFSKIPSLSPNEKKNYFETTYRQSYCDKFKREGYRPRTSNMFNNRGVWSGLISNYEPNDRIRISTQLISEKYNNGNEPKYNTECQRTWINYRDPGVRAVNDWGFDNTGKKFLPNVDNYLSYPMWNDREYEKVRSKTFFGCPRKISDITKRKKQDGGLRGGN